MRVPLRLAGEGVLVRRECLRLAHQQRTLGRGTVKRSEQGVEVAGERTHGDDLRRLGAGQTGQRFGQSLVVGHPRIWAVKMGFDAVGTPALKFGFEGRFDTARLKT